MLCCSRDSSDVRSENTPDWMSVMQFAAMDLGVCSCFDVVAVRCGAAGISAV